MYIKIIHQIQVRPPHSINYMHHLAKTGTEYFFILSTYTLIYIYLHSGYNRYDSCSDYTMNHCGVNTLRTDKGAQKPGLAYVSKTFELLMDTPLSGMMDQMVQ